MGGAGSFSGAPLNSSWTGAFLGWGAVCVWWGAEEAVHAFVQTWSLKATLETQPVGSGGFV